MNESAVQKLDDLNRRLRPALIAFFRRRVSDHAEAEDLTQEVFVRLARADDGHIASADHYVFRMAANLLRDRARRRKVRSDYSEAARLEDYAGIDPLDPYRITAGREDLALLARTIADLPEKTRRIFTLYRIENLDKRAIAETFGLSVRMVEMHIRRALTTVFERMGDEA